MHMWQTLLTLSILCLTLLGIVAPARAELPVVTGEHWTTASEREKKAFLIGMGTLLEVEQEIHGDNPPSDEQSFVPALIRGLSKFTITSAMQNINSW